MSSTGIQTAVPEMVRAKADMFACPACGGPLDFERGDGAVRCSLGQHSFEVDGSIPLLFWPNDWDGKSDVTEMVRSFYEETPFPNYDDVDSEWSLREKAERGVFARLLDEQIPYGAKVLEVGCGTGQLSNFLGLKWGRTVFGADLSLNSLTLGHGFKRDNSVENVAFVQTNLFRPAFKPESFDLVVSNGVLHHTSDPHLAFESIARLVKPGGHIVIGLYNTFGRIPTDIRRLIFAVSGNRFKFLDSRLRDKSLNEMRRHTWFMDQYKHPHESKHTIGEVMRWFDDAGFDFVKGIPKPRAFESFAEDEQLFAPGPGGSSLDHFIVQAGMLLTGGSEGGFFVMIGSKRAA